MDLCNCGGRISPSGPRLRWGANSKAPRLTIPTTDGGALAARTVLALRLAVLRFLQLLRQRKHLALSLRLLCPRSYAAEVSRSQLPTFFGFGNRSITWWRERCSRVTLPQA